MLSWLPLVLGLLGLASYDRSKQGTPAAANPAANAKRPLFRSAVSAAPKRPVAPAPPHEQAAVDAAVNQAIKEELQNQAAAANAPPAPAAARSSKPKPKTQTARAKPGAPPAAASPAKRAAMQLRVYLQATHDFGSKAKPSVDVKDSQRGMGGGLKPDGIVGPKTRARAKALGVPLPTS